MSKAMIGSREHSIDPPSERISGIKRRMALASMFNFAAISMNAFACDFSDPAVYYDPDWKPHKPSKRKRHHRQTNTLVSRRKRMRRIGAR